MDFANIPILDVLEFEEKYLVDENAIIINQYRGATYFKALDQFSKKEVFVKILNPEGDEIKEQDFKGSYSKIVALEHENVIQVIDVFKVYPTDNLVMNHFIPFVIYEYFEGQNLKYIASNLSETDLVEILSQVKNGLNYLHQNGWVHRDIKAENILVNKTGEAWTVKLIDIENLGQIGYFPKLIIGTTEFMAPEISSSSALTKAQDYWAFGCMIYELLFHKPMFGFRDNDLMGFEAIKAYQSRISINLILENIDKISNKYLKETIATTLLINPDLRRL
jgi:serine/threonine protein kinase